MSVCRAQSQTTKSAAEDSKRKIPLIDALIGTWRIHNDFNIMLLDSIKEEYLGDYSASKGRNVGEQFAHIHNTRVEWLTGIDSLAASQLTLFKEKTKITIATLKDCYAQSAAAIEKLLWKVLVDGKMKNYESHPANFLGYLISHESHHRGQIMLSLKQNGHPLSDKVSYGIWNWDKN